MGDLEKASLVDFFDQTHTPLGAGGDMTNPAPLCCFVLPPKPHANTLHNSEWIKDLHSVPYCFSVWAAISCCLIWYGRVDFEGGFCA